jgi:hypothetical protein
MTEPTLPKRPRGNPNFGKKKVEATTNTALDNKVPLPILTNVIEPAPRKDSDIWLQLYCAVLSTYSGAGPAVCKAAALNTDTAFHEYKARYAK